MRIAVCVITFQRCSGLRRLLASIATLRFQKTAPEVSVLIVDNDPNGSARSVATDMTASLPFKTAYEIEPVQGISSARNRALRLAANADFVAFIDDDETVSPTWLEELLLEQAASAADVVMGPVQPQFVRPVPAWIRNGGFFIKNNEKFGKVDECYGSTANILIRRSSLDGLAGLFAEKFNLTGGADYHLLRRLKGAGAKISWADRAAVSEFVEPDRAQARWILKRRFRIGNTIAMAERSLQPSWRPLKGFLRVLQGTVLLPFALLGGRAETVRKLGAICFGCGIIAGYCGYQYREYEFRKNPHPKPAAGDKKRLLYLSGALRVSTHPQAAVGGARSHVLGVMDAFKKLQWQVSACIAGDLVPLSWVIGSFDQEMRASLGKRIAADLIRLFYGFYLGLAAVLKFRHCDWVYERAGSFQNLGARFKKRGITWIVETNALLYQEAFLDRRAIFFQRLAKKKEIKVYRGCDAVICVSKGLKERVVAASGIDGNKVVVMPNGVDTDMFNPDIRPVRRFFKEPTIGFVGTLYGWQGLGLLLTAMAALPEDIPRLKLVLVGDGPELENLRNQADALGLGAAVHISGRIEWRDIPAFIAGFDIGFSGQVATAAGAWSGSPIKIYEFMAMGKPVIASAFEDACRVIADGRTGYLYKPGDPCALQEALATALAQREKWPAMGRLARTEIDRSHSWTTRLRTVIPQIESILAKK